MVTHAAGASAQLRDAIKAFPATSPTAAVVLAADADELIDLVSSLEARGIPFVLVRDPRWLRLKDEPWCDAAMAIGVVPTLRGRVRRLLAHLPTVRGKVDHG